MEIYLLYQMEYGFHHFFQSKDQQIYYLHPQEVLQISHLRKDKYLH